MAFKMKNPSMAKMAKQAGSAMKMKKAEPMKFNAGLRKASAEGKLDNNPKFKAAVDNAPKKLKKTPMQMKKAAMKLKDEAMKLKEKSAMMMKKAAMKLKKEEDAAMKMGHSPKKMKKSAMKLKGEAMKMKSPMKNEDKKDAEKKAKFAAKKKALKAEVAKLKQEGTDAALNKADKIKFANPSIFGR